MSRPKLAALAAVAALAAAPAAAQFQGRLEYDMKGGPIAKTEKGAKGSGKTVVWLGPDGARTEMSMKGQEGPMKDMSLVTLWRRSEPDRVYFLNDQKKVYSTFDVKDEQEEVRHEIERLGQAKVAGYSCERARITHGPSSSQELCITNELGKVPVHIAMDKRGMSLWNELRKAGLDGVPVSWKGGGASAGEEFSMVLTSAKRQKVPASLLSVPAGYQETSMAKVYATPEMEQQVDTAMKQLEERLKSMPPEQRKQMEEMMKKYGAGKK